MPIEIAAVSGLPFAATAARPVPAGHDSSAKTNTLAARTVEAPAAAAEQTSNARSVQAAAEQIESYLRRTNTNLEFSVDEAAGRVVVSVRERATGQLIRQIPSEEALRVAARLEQAVASILVNQES
jgi:flagellar protein FlaG